MTTADSGNGVDRNRELMMRALDGEISTSQSAELENLFETDDLLRAEWERLRRVKSSTAQLALKQPPDELWEGYMDSVYRRVERGIGWILLSVGAVVLVSYSVWQGISELIDDITIPWFVKTGMLALLVGIVILTVSVIREKYFIHKDDPYRDVHR